jgi:hypothetical protein
MIARLALVFIVLAGCASDGSFAVRKAAKELNAGIVEYESGNYREAEKSLQFAVDDGLFKSDEIRARKYLAFIHCGAARETRCRNEFERILQLDRTFELSVAEAGHPSWGPLFRRLKAQTAMNRK